MSFNALPDNSSTAIIPGDAFWPDLAVGEFQQNYRLPQEYAAELVSDHIALAQLWAVKQLAGWRKEQEASGYSTLSEIPLAGLPEGALISFKRAVFAYAKAILLEQFATIERREAARHDGRENPELSAIFYAHANRAIADILGLSQDCVELI